MLELTILTVIFYLVILYRKGYFFSCSFLFIISLYTLICSFLLSYTSGDHLLIIHDLAPVISKNFVFSYLFSLYIYLFFIFISILISRAVPSIISINKTSKQLNESYILCIVCAIIFLFGSLSLYYGGGQARIQSYVDGSTYVTPFHFYSGMLLPLVFYYLVKKITEKKYAISTLIATLAMPTVIDLFIAGRRQYFAPLFFLSLFLLLSSESISRSKKVLYLIALSLFIIILFTIIFSLRYMEFAQYSGESVSYLDFFGSFMDPILGELYAVGAISFMAYHNFIYSSHTQFLGIESFIMSIAKSMPGFKSLFTYNISDSNNLRSVLEEVAPMGALPMDAEAIIYFGYPGLLISALIIGTVLSFFDRLYLNLSKNEIIISYKNIIFLYMSSILFFKFRSGLIDSFSIFVKVGLFGIIIYFLAILLKIISTDRY